MAPSVSPEQRVDRLGTVQVLPEDRTTSLGQTGLQQTRTTERERRGSVAAWASFGTEGILRAPQSLPQAMEEGATGKGAGGPRVQATPEAFVERCQTLPWRFFAHLYAAFVAQVLPQAPLRAAAPLHPLRERFAEGWIVDGARLDAVAHRRKRLREGRARVLPGCVTAFYDWDRGITRHLHCNPDAAAGARPRATAARTHVPQDTLLVGDRWDGVGAFWAALTSRGIAGRCRRNGCQRWRWLRAFSKTWGAGGTAWDTLLEVKGNKEIPTQTWRWVRWRTGRESGELWTNVWGPAQLSGLDALSLYPGRWKGARVFFDRQEVLPRPRFYPSSPQGGAMQVYAAALGHTAWRVAQGHIAQASGMEPEASAPATFCPRLAAASIGLTWSELAFLELQQAKPGVALSKPDGRLGDFAWTTVEQIQVEPRNGRRRQRRVCQSRKQWQSFTHSPGGKQLT